MPDLIETLLRVVQADPGKAFLVQIQGDASRTLGYGDLLRRAWAFRDRLAAQGVAAGEVVLIILRHCEDQYPCFLGAMLLGALPSFMPFRTPRQDPAAYWQAHRQLFQRIGARVLVTFADNLEPVRRFLPDLELALIAVEDRPDWAEPGLEQALAREPVAAPDGLAFLQHSSGTTGLKKGVMLSHRAVLEQVRAYRSVLGFGPEQRIASWLPLYHDMGLIACFMLPLLAGATVVALDPFEWVLRPGLLLDAIAAHRCHFAWMPNFAFHHVARCAPEGRSWDLSSLRALIDCSEPCKPPAFEVFLERFGTMGVAREQLQVCYAMAETVFAVTQTEPGRAVAELAVARGPLAENGRVVPAAGGMGLLSCGRPIPGITLAILDEAGLELPEDRVGEIAVAGDFLFDGYFRLPEGTAERLREGRYLTGDRGFRHGGELYIVGRQDDQLTIYGQNHFAHDLEGCLEGLAGLIPGRWLALGRPNAEQGSQEAVILAEADGSVAEPALRKAVKQRVLDRLGLAVAAVRLLPRGWLLKTTSGKLNRQANRRKWLAEGEGDDG